MESAIPQHLQKNRTCPKNLVDSNYLPPFPAWTTRFDTTSDQFTVVYFGIQSKQLIDYEKNRLVTQYFEGENQPNYWVPAIFVDAQNYHHLVITAYWSIQSSFDEWYTHSSFKEWWQDIDRESESDGYFLEIYYPKITEFETIFSNAKTKEGIAHLSHGMSDEIQEHAYYGSMRDRLPKAQYEELNADQKNTISSMQLTNDSKRVIIKGQHNLSIIRSGQDWEETKDHERTLYLKEVEPILHQGMDFLAKDGRQEGCLSCRYMTVIDLKTGEKLNKTFGLAHFCDLKHLERWAKSHPTHVKIFGSFMKYVKDMNFDIQLKLFHEVMSLPSKSQYFEYISCHPKTGLLNGLSIAH